MNIEKRHVLEASELSGESYFVSLLQQAGEKGLIFPEEMMKIQAQCIDLLRVVCDSLMDSSSVPVELAENLMRSNFYTLGLELKSCPHPDDAVEMLQHQPLGEIYKKGRRLLGTKFKAARYSYSLAMKNRIDTENAAYNSTMRTSGAGMFFKKYSPDYAADSIPASIDYPLCRPVQGLVGVEYMQKYMERIFCENEFCKLFDSEKIHSLLLGYDSGYTDLLINIFEHVFMGALGCILSKKSPRELMVSTADTENLQKIMSGKSQKEILTMLRYAVKSLVGQLEIKNPSLIRYMELTLPEIAVECRYATDTASLKRIFVPSEMSAEAPKIHFSADARMDDEEYRHALTLIMEAADSERIRVIEENIRTFGDLEDVLVDAFLTEAEMTSLLALLGDTELAAMLQSHPLDVDFADLSTEEADMRTAFGKFLLSLPSEQQARVERILGALEE